MFGSIRSWINNNLPFVFAAGLVVGLSLFVWLLWGGQALAYASVAILASGVFLFLVIRANVHARATGHQSLTVGKTEWWVGIGLLAAIILLAFWGRAASAMPDAKPPKGGVAAPQGVLFPKAAIEKTILQYAIPLGRKRIPMTQTWNIDITKDDVKDPVFLGLNYALMEDGQFWWKFPAQNRDLQVMIGVNPIVADDSYYHIRDTEGSVKMFDAAAQFGVAQANPTSLRLYGSRIRPSSSMNVVMGGRLPRDKEMLRVALFDVVDAADAHPFSTIPKGYYCRLYIRFATEDGYNLSQDVMDQPVAIDPNGVKPPVLPGILLKGFATGNESAIPMGERRVKGNAYTDGSETEINSFDPRWPQEEDLVVYVITPATDGKVRAEVIVRVEPLQMQ